jgi:flagellar biosynthesis GTPase FlhF
MKARAEKTAHTQEQLAEQQTFENVDDDDDTIDRELERVQQKIQQLQKDKEKFASQLQAKRKISEKLEQLNKAKEQIEKIQREIDEMKEQENSSLWQESPHQNSGPTREPPKENFFAGNGISHFVDSKSPLSIGLQAAPWPPKFKPVSLPKYNGFGNSRQFLMRYESAVNSAGGDDVALAKSFIIACEGPVLNGTPCYRRIQSTARQISRQSSCKHFRCSMTQQPKHQICTTASRKTESHCGTS